MMFERAIVRFGRSLLIAGLVVMVLALIAGPQAALAAATGGSGAEQHTAHSAHAAQDHGAKHDALCTFACTVVLRPDPVGLTPTIAACAVVRWAFEPRSIWSLHRPDAVQRPPNSAV